LPVYFIYLRLERVDNLGAYRIPPETGILIPSDFVNRREQISAIIQEIFNTCLRMPRSKRTPTAMIAWQL
jgi:hypothetical protein